MIWRHGRVSSQEVAIIRGIVNNAKALPPPTKKQPPSSLERTPKENLPSPQTELPPFMKKKNLLQISKPKKKKAISSPEITRFLTPSTTPKQTTTIPKEPPNV
jgi:hypothetical protein